MFKAILLSICLIVFLLANGFFSKAAADHEEHKERRHHNEKRECNKTENHEIENFLPVKNTTYSENCGSCHFAYQPGLLPANSWTKIVNDLATHFGEPVVIDQNDLKIISEYLAANSADASSTEESQKIMESLGSQAPIRITEIPYIQKKHHEITQDILSRKSVGSLSNCSACHKDAEKGLYDDDNVAIPK
jgi:hypothetical protein